MTITRAAIYTRVSTEEQAREDKSSLAQQRERCEAYCRTQEWEVVEVYEDAGVSGAKEERYGRMLRGAEQGAFEVVVFYSMTRLGRSSRLILDHEHELDRLGIRVILVEQSVDTGTTMGRFFFNTMANVAELERSMIRDRMTDGRIGAAGRGTYMANRAPYGYLKTEDKRLVEDPATATVVRQVFAWANQGLGLKAIAERLNDAHVPIANPGRAKTAEGWIHSSVYKVLTARRYVGDAVFHTYGKREGKRLTTLTPMACPALVTVEEFKGAQASMSTRRKNSSRSTKTWYMLQHHVFCRLCGAVFYGRVDSHGRRSYACRDRVYRSTTAAEHSTWRVDADEVEGQVKVWLLELLSDPAAVLQRAELFKDRSRSRSLETEENLTRLHARVDDLDRQDAVLLDALVKGRVTGEQFDETKARVARERAETETQLAEAEAATVEPLTRRERVQALEDFLSGDVARRYREAPRSEGGYLKGLDTALYHSRLMAQQEPWRDLVHLLVDRVWVEDDGQVTIEGVLPTVLPANPSSPRRG